MIYLTVSHNDMVSAEIDAIFRQGAWLYKIIMRDLDSDNVVVVLTCPDRNQAIAKAHSIVNTIPGGVQ